MNKKERKIERERMGERMRERERVSECVCAQKRKWCRHHVVIINVELLVYTIVFTIIFAIITNTNNKS